MFCSHCGKPQPANARFCTNCGRELALSIPSCAKGSSASSQRVHHQNKNGQKPRIKVSIVMIIGGIIGYVVGSVLSYGLSQCLKTKGSILSLEEVIIGVPGYIIMVSGGLCVLWGVKRLIAISNYPEPSKD